MAHLAWLAAIGLLLGYEWYAIKYGKMTLSRAVVNTFRAWPLLGFVVGLIAGGLAVHFFGGDWSCFAK